MSFQSQIEALERLARIDGELSKIEEQLAGQRNELGAKKDQVSELETKLAESQASLQDMDRMRGELVQEARQMSLQMERSREKLARCRSEREVNAVQREVEEVRKLYRDREIEIDKLTNLAETARAEYEESVKQRDELLGELGASEGESASQLGELETDVAQQRKARAEVAKDVPRSMLRRYEAVRKRRGDGLTWTTEGTCAICHMLLPPMLFQTLMRRNSFDQCPSCQRIIYFRESPPPGLGESSEAPAGEDEAAPEESSEST